MTISKETFVQISKNGIGSKDEPWVSVRGGMLTFNRAASILLNHSWAVKFAVSDNYVAITPCANDDGDGYKTVGGCTSIHTPVKLRDVIGFGYERKCFPYEDGLAFKWTEG